MNYRGFLEITYKTELLDNALKHDVLKFTYNDFGVQEEAKEEKIQYLYAKKIRKEKII